MFASTSFDDCERLQIGVLVDGNATNLPIVILQEFQLTRSGLQESKAGQRLPRPAA